METVRKSKTNDVAAKVIVGNCLDILENIKRKSINLVLSSPPYGIGKEYESVKSENEYRAWASKIVDAIAPAIADDGAICWQVGNWVDVNGSIVPLDCLYIELFRKAGFHLKNRIIWTFGHGQHCPTRLSPRYETVLWFVKNPKKYTFNLDEVRVPAESPGKRAYKGPNKGELSGHPLGKNPSDVWNIMLQEWESGVWNLPSVKHGHVEKTKHPCQFPIELAERCVLCFSKEGDIVFDPFCGSGSSLIAAEFHKRKSIGVDLSSEYAKLTMERLESLRNGTLKHRKIGTAVYDHKKDKRSEYPEDWYDDMEKFLKKPRLSETPQQRAYGEILSKRISDDE